MLETDTNYNYKRTKPWGLKVHEDFFWKVKKTALEERCEVVDLVERVLGEYMETKHTHTHKPKQKPHAE